MPLLLLPPPYEGVAGEMYCCSISGYEATRVEKARTLGGAGAKERRKKTEGGRVREGVRVSDRDER